ncbi:hypothetical protein NQ314_014005 [Rhamnusium bicolor]|uniref:Aspartate/ornithine carbamoyltransferase Asp/Orn-binding domain-containing protein n=1 Tax=Rhamnusium bicolor TaxID=1586634 RepID=A0AAV8X4U9_9CUCU|nr:hypothetical protein NQ314_014005 [Rhamnusium bicolor]
MKEPECSEDFNDESDKEVHIIKKIIYKRSDLEEVGELDEFTSPKTKIFFTRFNIETSFFEKSPSEWDADEGYRRAETTVEKIRVTNDTAEKRNLLTIQEHFGSLKGIIISWVGKACPLLNTYLTIAPPLGIKVKFLCQCGGPVSPSSLKYVQSQGTNFTDNIKECGKLEDAIEADLEKYADKNWVFLHTLPRSLVEVEDKLFDSERNLLWKSFVNSKWICAAIIARFLVEDPSLITDKGNNNYRD